MPAFNIEPYHKTILGQLEGLDLTQSGSVNVAQFAAGMLSVTAVPPESLPGLIAGVDDLIRRMTESQASFASRVALILQVGVDSLKQRRDPRSDANSRLLAATGYTARHGADPSADADFRGGHGEQQIRGPITMTGARGMPDRHLGGDGHASGCPFATGPAAHAHHDAAPDPGTVVGNRGLGRPQNGDVAGNASHGEH